MKRTLLGIWLIGTMGLGANAIPIWSPSWHDANYGGETFDKVEYFIVNGGSSAATFATAPTIQFDTGNPVWTGNYVNPTYGYVTGSAVTLSGAVGDTMALYFAGARPSQNDIRLDVLYWNGNTLVSDLCWSWLNLPNYGYEGGVQWAYIPNLDSNRYNRTPGGDPPGNVDGQVDHILPSGSQPVPDVVSTGTLLSMGLVALGGIRWVKTAKA